MLTRITKGLFRGFCSGQSVQQKAGTSVIEGPKVDEVPVYLRPYDKSKYETLLQKIKLNSGTVLLSQGTPSLRSNPSLVPK